jgi:hypothetical protein
MPTNPHMMQDIKMKITKARLKQIIKEEMNNIAEVVELEDSATRFDPEPRRELKQGEIEIMKGRGDVQKWFYVDSAQDAMTLVELGRNYGFPTGIIQNLSGEQVPQVYSI